MNTTLVEYGIGNEQSDIRAHVCVNAGKVYAYRTGNGIAAIQSGKFREVPVYLEINGRRVQTATGYIVPPSRIPGCREIDARDLIDRMEFSEADSESQRGDKAQRVVTGLIERCLFPLPAQVEIVTDRERQYQGIDLVVTARQHIQVKCDWRGGESDHADVTGNLFLQTRECNPYSMV